MSFFVILKLLKVLNNLFYSNYGHIFGPRPQMIKQEIHVHIPCGWCVAEADWLIPGHSICDDQWHCVLQIRGVFSKMAAILFVSAPVRFSGDNYRSSYFFKAFLVINNVSRVEWTYICEKQTTRKAYLGTKLHYICQCWRKPQWGHYCGRQRTMLKGC